MRHRPVRRSRRHPDDAHVFPAGVLVRPGQRVTAGQNIAEVGNAGLSAGCHLHFEVRQNGTATPPTPFLDAHGV